MDIQHFTGNGNQRFPLTTETLATLQQQIMLLQAFGYIAGSRYIVRQSTATTDGCIFIDGEILTLQGAPADFINIVVADETLAIADQFSGTVRTRRTAVYSDTMATGGYIAADFQTLASADDTLVMSNAALSAALTEARRHIVPTGTIVMWSGAVADIPEGWALCDGTGGTPDLRGRFIVGAAHDDGDGGSGYAVGATGGEPSVTLKVSQIPEHTHIYAGDDELTRVAEAEIAEAEVGEINVASIASLPHTSYWVDKFNTTPTGGSQPHENRPPYFALAYIMKII